MERALKNGIVAALLVIALAGTSVGDPAYETPVVIENTWDGYISCATHVFGVGAIDCGSVDPNQDRFRTEVVDEGIRGIVFALDWEPEPTTFSISESARQSLVLRVVHVASGYTYIRLESHPPLEVTLAADVGGQHALQNFVEPTEIDIQVLSSGGFGGLAYQQPFTLYWHEYYWAEPDENATALP